jgi:type IV pilus assembly protein PilO
LGAIKREEEQLKEAFLVKKRQAINLDLIKKQLDETQQSLGALLKQLPSKSEMDALLTDINQAGLGRGLQFELFKPGAEVFRKPGPEVPKSSPGAETVKSGTDDSFAEQPIVLKVTGSYDDIGKFASDIAMLPRIVTLNDVAITPVAKGGLSMDATAKTFRYLSEEEIAARSKASGKK